MFSNKYHINRFLDITFKIHDGIQKVLNKLYVQFWEKILNFEGAVMVQPSGAFFFINPVYLWNIFYILYSGFLSLSVSPLSVFVSLFFSLILFHSFSLFLSHSLSLSLSISLAFSLYRSLSPYLCLPPSLSLSRLWFLSKTEMVYVSIHQSLYRVDKKKRAAWLDHYCSPKIQHFFSKLHIQFVQDLFITVMHFELGII